MKKKIAISIITGIREIRNGGKNFKNFLLSIKSQTLDKKLYELIIVNYGGDKKIETVINSVEEKNIKYVYVNEQGQFNESRSKNIGIRHAQGSYIICTNADIIFTKKSLEVIYNSILPNNTENLLLLRRRELPDGYENEFNLREIIDNKVLNNSKIKLSSLSAIGDFQGLSKVNWFRLMGYDERMVGWGAMDIDLKMRSEILGLSTHWMDDLEVKIYHQYHEKNKKLLGLKHNVNLMLMQSGVKNKPDENWGKTAIKRIFYVTGKGNNSINNKQVEIIFNSSKLKCFEKAIELNADYLIEIFNKMININGRYFNHNLVEKYDVIIFNDENGNPLANIYNKRAYILFHKNTLKKYGPFYNLAVQEYSRTLELTVGRIRVNAASIRRVNSIYTITDYFWNKLKNKTDIINP